MIKLKSVCQAWHWEYFPNGRPPDDNKSDAK